MSDRYIASGSSVFSPILKAGVGDVGPMIDVALRERLVEVVLDEPADLQRLQVVGVLVAARQRVGAEHDAALDLGAEALAARLRQYMSIRSGRTSARWP